MIISQVFNIIHGQAKAILQRALCSNYLSRRFTAISQSGLCVILQTFQVNTIQV